MAVNIVSFSPKPVLAYETLTVSTAAVGLTETVYRPQIGNTASDRLRANSAFVSVEDNEIRYSIMPGTTPTATTNGHEAGAATSFELHGQQIVDFLAIRTGGAGTDGVLRITYFA